MSFYQFRLYRPPIWLRQLLYPTLTWARPDTEKVIYLTFDDGPIPILTPFILDTLQEFQAKGTFFCVGDNIRKHPQIFERTVAEGHTVGNHTFNHLKGWYTPQKIYLQNIQLCQEQIKSYLPNKKRLLFRPPYGMISRSQIKALLPTYEIVMWDVLTYDYATDLPPQTCLQAAIKHIRSGSIVVFHDNIKAGRNMTYTLPKVLAHFTEKGFRFSGL